ncbi:30S ribosomal protein S7 [Candidatus Marsarchaeota archaeon]|nr:30S ribosomal protein S7 [Candidatus Marsarchaeota archaeon]MCL5404933.1 30S ribosomal protein S7 [Candidatus Marsarchaeota archaeon]
MPEEIANQSEVPKPKEASKQQKPRRRQAQQRRKAEPESARSTEHKLFNKYDYNVEVLDLSLKNYINLTPVAYPNSYRRTSSKMFSKANINIVERLENAMMRGGTGKKIGGKVIRTKGRLQGKKLKVMHIIEKAFDSVNEQTKQNPFAVFIRALENSAPIEDTTRIRQGGTVSNIPVDISASRRLDIALRNIATASIIGAFNKKQTIAETLANELILASNNDINSYAIKRKNEIERMARSAK